MSRPYKPRDAEVFILDDVTGGPALKVDADLGEPSQTFKGLSGHMDCLLSKSLWDLATKERAKKSEE